jgi:hypothetical protein
MVKLTHLLCLAATAAALTESDVLKRFESLEARNAETKAENAQMKATLLEMKAENAATSGELRMFNAEQCPSGWVEFNRTQGYLLTGRPKGGETSTTINRPMAVGEKGRSPEHSHEVEVEDLGHSHVTAVNDPGHQHSMEVHVGKHDDDSDGDYAGGAGKLAQVSTNTSKTGIVVDALPAKSNIQVSLSSPNEGAEGYPLVYVLICQRALGN